jgi:hypothetical protein
LFCGLIVNLLQEISPMITLDDDDDDDDDGGGCA